MDDATLPQDELEGLDYTTPTLAELLTGATFPTDRDTLADHLEGRNAPDDVVSTIRASDRNHYDSEADVLDVVGSLTI